MVEVLLDDHDAPIDYRVLEVNPIFEQQTGLHQAVGKTARQLNLEAHWIEIYGQVALTGESIRFENGSEALNRWFDVYACGTGEPQARKVAIVFRDISDRKRHEANLAFLANIAEDLSRLSSAHEIMQTVGAKLGAHLNLSHGLFAEIDAAQDRVVVEYAWNPSDAPDLIGVYQLSQFVTEEFQRAARAGETIVIRNTQTDVRTDANRYAAFNIHAFVSVPFHRNNEWKYLLTVNHAISRDWLEDEIELVRELANCVFPRLERARAEAIVAADLQDTKLLRELGARLTTEGDIQTLYQAILSTAIALTRADAGTVQILDEATQELVLLAAQGFEPTMLKHFYRLNESSNTPCAVALKNGRRSFVDFDVPESEHPDGVRRILTEAGYLSGQSTPLTTRSGKIIGMVSTQWRDHHRPSDRELRFLDLLARQAADLIEQRQTEAALRDSENRLRMTIEAAQLGTWDWDLITNHLIWDEGCKALFGLSPEAESSIEVFSTGLHPDDRERLEQVVQWTLNPDSGGKYDVEYRTIGIQDGIERWIAARGQVYFDAADNPQRFVGTVLNITEQKRIEVEREQFLTREQAARAEADRANRIKDEFLAVLSHELRSPLNPILGWAKLLRGGKLDPTTTAGALATIERNAKLQSQLVDDLLDVSRIMQGKLALNVAPVSLAFVISSAIETVRLAAEVKSIGSISKL